METSATTIVVPPTAEEQRIASIADSINLADPSLTVTYGTEAMQGISRFADDLLSRVQAKDSGELGESLTNLMLKVKDVNVSEVMGSPGFLQSLPLVGSLFSSAKRTVAKFNTLSEQIEIIVDKLDEAMIGLLRDIETLEMLYEHNARFHAELTAYIEAGKRKLEEARTVELPRLKAQADASGDLMEAQQVRDLSEQINRFERRLHDLQLSRTITVQTAPQQQQDAGGKNPDQHTRHHPHLEKPDGPRPFPARSEKRGGASEDRLRHDQRHVAQQRGTARTGRRRYGPRGGAFRGGY